MSSERTRIEETEKDFTDAGNIREGGKRFEYLKPEDYPEEQRALVEEVNRRTAAANSGLYL